MKILKDTFILIFIIFIFYYSNKTIFKKNIKENYLTYFLPFYNKEISSLTNFYNNDENNLNYFKKKFNYYILKFGVIKNDFNFANLVVSEYISKSTLYRATITEIDNRLHGLDLLLKNQLDFNLNNYATIIYYSETLKGNIDNIRLVTSLYNLYIYIFTKKMYKIYNLDNIPFGCIIGILNPPSVFYLYYKKFFTDLGYTENSDYKVKFYNNISDLFDGFSNNECQMIIFSDVFPSKDVINKLNNILSPDMILLPFEMSKENLFLKQNPHINISYVDLNLLGKSYFPKKFGNYEYTKNRPTLKMANIHKILLTHKNTDPLYTYNVIKFFYENWRYINETLDDKAYKITKIEIDNTNIGYLDYHDGVLKYFYEMGLITNTNNDNCKYLYGVMECNETTLANNGLLLEK
jgi:TRAP-type uncharacterized transport system substrate-binding protein